MVAINFTKFLDKVASGEKRMTIRRTARARPGDRIQLYTDMRKPTCRKLRKDDPVCVAVQRVIIREDDILVDMVEDGLPDAAFRNAHQSLARADGFPDFAAMKDFFREKYGLPFTGYAHVWEFPTQPRTEAGTEGE